MSDKRKKIEVYKCENPRCYNGFVSDPECSKCCNVSGSNCNICKPCPECCGLGIKFNKEKFHVFTSDMIEDMKIDLRYAAKGDESFVQELTERLDGRDWDSIRDTQDYYLK